LFFIEFDIFRTCDFTGRCPGGKKHNITTPCGPPVADKPIAVDASKNSTKDLITKAKAPI